MGCRWRGFGDGATTLGEARNIAAEHIHVCPRNGSLIQDATEAKEEAQYRRQLEGTRQATQAEGVRQAEDQRKILAPRTDDGTQKYQGRQEHPCHRDRHPGTGNSDGHRLDSHQTQKKTQTNKDDKHDIGDLPIPKTATKAEESRASKAQEGSYHT